MVMGLPSYAAMTAAVVLVEPALQANLVVKVPVHANPTVLDVNAVMMDVDTNPVEPVHLHKLVQMVCVPEPQLLIVLEELVDPTEPEEVVELVPLVKDVVLVNVSATTTVMKETVEMQSNLQMPTPQLALKDHVVLAHPVSLAVLMEDAMPKHPVPFLLQWSTVLQDNLFQPPVQLLSHQPL